MGLTLSRQALKNKLYYLRSSVSSVRTKDGVSEERTASAAGTGESLSLERVNSLVIAHLKSELAREVSLGDVELNAVNIRALVLSNCIDVESALTGEVIALVLEHIGGNLALVVNYDFGTVGNIGMEAESLGTGVVSELTGSRSGVLLKCIAESTVCVTDVERLDFRTFGTDGFVCGVSRIGSNCEIVSPENFRLFMVECAASLEFEQTAGNETIGTADSNSLVTL